MSFSKWILTWIYLDTHNDRDKLQYGEHFDIISLKVVL